MSPAPRISRLWWVTGPLLAVLVGALVVVGAMRVPYVTFAPGGARAVEPLITVSVPDDGPKVDDEPPSDDLLYLTVATRVEPSGLVALFGWLDDQVQVEPSDPYLGTQSPDENRALNLELMTDSQDKARKVALEKLGYTVTSTPQGVFLEDVDPSYPAASQLKPGMTVVGADGKPVHDVDQLVAAIQTHQPGDTMTLDVIPLGASDPTTVTVELGRRGDDPSVAAVGIRPVDRVSYTFPVDIAIDTGQVGGPSAGLAFTLAILDRLTPGSLTGDQRVAVTGTIELDGTVGPVGGVDHKTEAAIREGAKLFLVPPGEEEIARKTARGRLEVKPVANLDEALAALAAAGGDPLPASGS